MFKRLIRSISVMLVTSVVFSMAVYTNVNALTISKEIFLYAVPSDLNIEIPDGYETSYQITLEDLGLTEGTIETCRSVSYQADIPGEESAQHAVCTTAKGLVTPGLWYYKDGYGTTNPQEEYTYTVPVTGYAAVQVVVYDTYGRINLYYVLVHTYNYAKIFAEQTIDQFIADNITPDMSVRDIVIAATKWTAETFSYGNKQSAYDMVSYGYGDCWASANLIVLICSKCGLKAWSRNANRDWGSGSGHRNAIIEDPENGVWYIGEAGSSGSAPRNYSVYARDSLYCFRVMSASGKTCEVYQLDAHPDDYANATVIEVPSQVDGYTVAAVGASFLSANKVVSRVVLPDTVTRIGNYAFSGCSALTDIVIPSSVTYIGINTFASCTALQSVQIPSSVTDIDAAAFYRCTSLEEVTIPSGVASVSEAAFDLCSSLSRIRIPSSVTSVGINAFDGCDSLTDVYFDGTEEQWNSITIEEGNDPLLGAAVHFAGDDIKTGWVKEENVWHYYNNDGLLQTGWINDGGAYYYLDPANDNAMTTGWKMIGSKWYFFNASGAMQKGWVKDNGKWYYMDGSGAMVNGWKKISGKWYYFNSSGEMQTGWVKYNNKWYYLNPQGDMKASSWLNDGGKWYYFDAAGVMVKGWLDYAGSRYYLDGSGAMVANRTITIDGVQYSFDASGHLK